MKNVEKKKIVIIFSILLILILIFLLIGKLDMDNIFSSSGEKLKNDKLELQKEINILKEENDNLHYENDNLVKHLENLEEQIQQLGGQTNINKKCTFVKTLQYIESSSYKGQANERFVLFAKFQSFSPILLRISEDKNIKFEKDAYYEIKFSGNVSDKEQLEKYEIISINKTNKVGFDQIQDICK